MVWARQKLEWQPLQWMKLISSDEKKFNLDGPDGLAHYWHDLRREERVFSKRQQGGESVMLWGAMSYFGLSNLHVLDGRQDAKAYCRNLEQGLLGFAAETLGEDWKFQKDNAPIHTAKLHKKVV